MPFKTKTPHSKQPHEGLLEIESFETPWEKLPVEHLKEVKKQGDAEFRAREPRMRRLGALALDFGAVTVLMTSNPQMWAKNSEQIDESLKSGKGVNRVGKAVAKRNLGMNDRAQRIRNQRRAAREQAAEDYRNKHPEITEHENKLRHNAMQEMHAKDRRRAINEISRRESNAMSAFAGVNGGFSTFIKSLPGEHQKLSGYKFDGDYAGLAKKTLEQAVTYRKEDGSVPLQGFNIAKQRVSDQDESGMSISEIRKAGVENYFGVGALAEQMGFVEITQENVYSNGGHKAKFSDDINWERSKESTTAQITFDSNNELHNMLIREDESFTNPVVQMEVTHPDGYWGRNAAETNLSVVEAPVPQVAEQPMAA